MAEKRAFDKRGFSLRQKKSSRVPEISAPKQLTTPSNTVPTASRGPPPRVNGLSEKLPNANRERPGKQGGNTADLVKRRYSTRFAQLPGFSNADAPPLPNGHLPHQQPKLNQAPSKQIESVNVDVAALKDPNLDPEKYSATVLADASDQQLRDYRINLRKLKNRASTDLQQNVYQNRTQFIKISKDAEKLNEEMRMLRGLVADVSSTVDNLVAKASIPESRTVVDDVATRARKQANRSSLADLGTMRNNQLHQLWKSVEGSQKYLPATPGRHIVLEQSQWVELDAATWKTRKRVHLVLSNDHLLVATEKKKRVDPSTVISGGKEQKAVTKLVAEKCWPLQDIDMQDLAMTPGARDKRGMINAISIRCGHEVFTYRSDRPADSDKSMLLRAFSAESDKISQTLRADMESNAKNKEAMDYYAARDPTISERTDLLKSLSISKDRPEIRVDVDGKQRDMRWVEGQIDELDVAIALQHFEEAVRYVEKLRKLGQGLKGNSTAQDLIITKVDGRARQLAGATFLSGKH
ncbi:MAG: hypothetical protein Q9219_003818 [cf. Caloplaca sp. 3 TL-2023]